MFTCVRGDAIIIIQFNLDDKHSLFFVIFYESLSYENIPDCTPELLKLLAMGF